MHTVEDDVLGTIMLNTPYNLTPGEVINTVDLGLVITDAIEIDTTNTVTWTAFITDTEIEAEDSDSATVNVTFVEPGITISKTVGTNPGVCATTNVITVTAGTPVYYCYTVHNTGNVAFDYHVAIDDQLGDIINAFIDLAPDETINTVDEGFVFSATPEVTTTNNVEWTAWVWNTSVQAQDTSTATVNVVPGPPPTASIVVTKTVGTEVDTCASTNEIEVTAGSTVYYCYTVMNTGELALTQHSVVDDQLGNILTDFDYILAPGASTSVIVSATIDITTTNAVTWTAFITGTEIIALDSDSATVIVMFEEDIYYLYLPVIIKP